MKRISMAAVAAAMLLVSGGAPAAFAKGGDATAEAPKLKLSPAFSKAAQPVDAALKAGNNAAVPALLPALDAAASTPDDKYVAGMLRYQYAGRVNDPAMQLAGVTTMINSGSVTADLATLNVAGGQAAFVTHDYATAQRMLSEGTRLGYKTSAMPYVMLAETQIKQKAYQPSLATMAEAMRIQQASGQAVPEDWYKRTFAVAYAGKSPDTADWGSKLLAVYPNPTNWRMVLETYLERFPERSAQLDIFRLMSVTGSIPGEAGYLNYASVAWESGLPGETMTVVNEAYAKGGAAAAASNQLRELKGLAAGKIPADKASLAASAQRGKAAADGKPALGAADGYLSYGQYAEAAPLYRTALSKGGVDTDQTNMHLGIALARSGDKAGAISAFQAVKGPRAGLAQLWITYLNKGA